MESLDEYAVLLLKRVQTHHATPVHAALSVARNDDAMLLGTTLTKNSQRPANSPASARTKAAIAPLNGMSRERQNHPRADQQAPAAAGIRSSTGPKATSAEARNSNCSDRESHRNLSAMVSSCAAAPATAARTTHSRSAPLKFSVQTNIGPSSSAVEKNSAMV